MNVKVGAPGQWMGLPGTVTLLIEQTLCGTLHPEHFAYLIPNPAKALLGKSASPHCVDQNTEA